MAGNIKRESESAGGALRRIIKAIKANKKHSREFKKLKTSEEKAEFIRRVGKMKHK